MIINYYKYIEKYLIGKLKNEKLHEFIKAMNFSPELAAEVKLQSEIFNAIRENDIMNMRSNLNEIIKPKFDMNTKPDKFFDLAQNLNQAKISDDANVDMNQIENTLQFIHIENHKKSQTERIHLISSDLQENEIKNNRTISDNDLWKEISYSINENDIIDLRNNLKQVISFGSTDISDFEIDQFLDNELTEDAHKSFVMQMNEDKYLSEQVQLHREINDAFNEKEITALRNSIGNIIDDEQMVSYSEIKRIDDYLMNYLNEKEHNEFEELLTVDIRLNAETELNNEINNSVQEIDIMKLRASLDKITNEDQSEKQILQFIPTKLSRKPVHYISAAASVAAVVSLGAMTFMKQKSTAEEIYRASYIPYDATGLYRSGSLTSNEMLGVDKYNEQNYESALNIFKEVLTNNPEHPMCNFYSGLCYQQLGNFSEAILSFQNVINEKDNLFIEQAEWFKALCQLNTNTSKAYLSLNAILDKKGYYSKNAKEILRKLK